MTTKITKRELQKIKEWYDEGKAISNICNFTGLTRGKLLKIVEDNKWPKRDNVYVDQIIPERPVGTTMADDILRARRAVQLHGME